jgi:membrane associated rhomboid family serine protease
MEEEMDHIHKKGKQDFYKSVYYPLLFVMVLWVVKFIEVVFDTSFGTYGVYPQTLSGLKGIIFSPLVHGDYKHLISNSFPLLILGGMLFYFYKEIAHRVILIGWIALGFWLWIIGRESFHIGASGLIYFMAAFLFVSGILRKHTGLMAVSLVVIFLYGSIVWGIFPLVERVSWEGHFSGLVAGIVLAFFFRKQGPQRRKYQFEIDEEFNLDDNDDESWKITSTDDPTNLNLNYLSQSLSLCLFALMFLFYHKVFFLLQEQFQA